MTDLTNQVGINISNTSIQLVEISNKKNKVYLENVDEEFFEENLEPNLKEPKFIHILQNAFNEILLRKPLVTSKVLISLPLNFFKIFEIPVDKNLTKNDLTEYCNWEFSKLFPTENIKDYSLQKINLETPTYQPFLRFMIYAIKKDLLKRIFKFCVRNNLTLKSIDISHISANSLLAYNNPQLNCFSLWIDEKNISSIYIVNSNIVFSKSKNYLNISEVMLYIKDIFSEIENRNLMKSKITEIFFLGSTISNELINNLKNSCECNLKIINPFDELNLDVTHLKNSINVNSTKFNAALGMALRLIS
ncbi:MAG: pilus assembly protein PilM [Ignavibacteriae bacterium]|nr:pilus assembly protein PilM [Ignavibacteriota bacterium]